MYTVVLMVAMTGGTEVPDLGRRRRGRGCNGGYACSGCYYGGYGCSGGYGCCSGGGYGGYGCMGGGYPVAPTCNGAVPDTNGNGDVEGTANVGYGGYRGGVYGTRGARRGAPGAPRRNPERIRSRPKDMGADLNASRPATVVLSVPADARVTFNGQPTTSRSTSRVFVTPPLAPDRAYYYEVEARVERDGQSRTVTRRMPVRAGQEVRRAITFPPAAQVVRNR
jgi:uncharacterized protein (TIGR03000 family)